MSGPASVSAAALRALLPPACNTSASRARLTRTRSAVAIAAARSQPVPGAITDGMAVAAPVNVRDTCGTSHTWAPELSQV